MAEDKGKGKPAKTRTSRCSRSQMKPNATVTPVFTAEKEPKYQTDAARGEARTRRTKRQARYQNSKAPKTSEGIQLQCTSLVLAIISVFLFSFLLLVSCMVFLFPFYSCLYVQCWWTYLPQYVVSVAPACLLLVFLSCVYLHLQWKVSISPSFDVGSSSGSPSSASSVSSASSLSSLPNSTGKFVWVKKVRYSRQQPD